MSDFDRGYHFFDRAYKISAMLGMVLALGMIVVGLRQIFVISKKLDTRTQQILMSEDCVVSLFTNPGSARSQLAIQQSINKCTIIKK